MPTRYTEHVVQILAQHLGVSPREIALAHDLQRDWGLTPLSLVVILLDLERSVAIELPPEELSRVRTVADLVSRFRGWVQRDETASAAISLSFARDTRPERRLRRELHHLRWLEQRQERHPVHVLRLARARERGAARRVANG